MEQPTIATFVLDRYSQTENISIVGMKPAYGTGEYYTKLHQDYTEDAPHVVSHCYAYCNDVRTFFIIADRVDENEICIFVYGTEKDADKIEHLVKKEIAHYE